MLKITNMETLQNFYAV